MQKLRQLAATSLVLLMVFSIASPAHAALTEPQIQAVISLLRAFAVDSSVLVDAEAALRGNKGPTSEGEVQGVALYCPSLSMTLKRRMADAQTGGQVSELQKFLASYYTISTSDIVTGYFGAETERYVKKFQREKRIDETGTVGPLTRAAIAALCPVSAKITLTSPSSNSTVVVGQPIPISWVISGAPANSQVELALKNVQPSSPSSGAISGGTWQGSLLPQGSSTGMYSWITGGNGYLDFTGSYELIGRIKLCDPAGCDYYYGPTPIYAESSPVNFTLAPTLPPPSLAMLSAAVDASTPVSANVIAGASYAKVGAFKFTAQQDSFVVNRIVVKVPAGAATSIASVVLTYKDQAGSTRTTSQVLGLPGSGQPYAQALFTGLTFYIPTNSDRVLDVSVNTIPIVSGATSGAQISVLLDGDEGYEARDSLGNSDYSLTNSTADLASNQTRGYGTLVLRKSEPTLTASVTGGVLTAGTNQVLGRFMAIANPAGDVDLYKITFDITKSSAVALSVPTVYAGGYVLSGSFGTTTCPSGTTSCTLRYTATSPHTIAAGQSRTLDLRATVGQLTSGTHAVVVGIPSSSFSVMTGTAAIVSAPSAASPSLMWSDWSDATDHAQNPIGVATTDWTNDYLVKTLPLVIGSLTTSL